MFIFQIIVKIRIHHQTRSRTLYKLIYREIFYPAFFLCACERSFETASFCLKFWLFSSRLPRKLILSIFSKSKRPFKKTNYTTVNYLPIPIYGSFENEALENEDRSTKHPNLENEAPKTRKRRTQISKTKHPNLENEAPMEKEALENEAP